MLNLAKTVLTRWNDDNKTAFKTAFGNTDNAARNAILDIVNKEIAVNAIITLANFKVAQHLVGIDPATLYAFVYPTDQTRIVYLGTLFWTAPAVGRDSQGGVLLHEMSHWFGTKDSFPNYNGGASVYGISASHVLARSHPELAIKHADSFEYFGEH